MMLNNMQHIVNNNIRVSCIFVPCMHMWYCSIGSCMDVHVWHMFDTWLCSPMNNEQ